MNDTLRLRREARLFRNAKKSDKRLHRRSFRAIKALFAHLYSTTRN
jgi:hypothetical protein